MTRDPVCGMAIDVRQAAGRSNYQGQDYYFCSPRCKEKFDQDPQRYASQQPAQH